MNVTATNSRPVHLASSVARIGSRGLPARTLSLALTASWRQVIRRHPALASRLRSLAGQVIRIEPADLPIGFVLRFHSDSSSVEAVPVPAAIAATAVVRGPLQALLGLFEGGEDGDALFFSRQLSIEGDLQAVLALRNELDAECIDFFLDGSPLPEGAALTRAAAWVARAALTGIVRTRSPAV